MASRSRPDKLERELEALRPALAAPTEPGSREKLSEALLRGRSMVAFKAAALIRDRCLDGFQKDLQAAFDRFLNNPVKTDPSCKAKLAALEALDALESLDPSPFLKGIRHFQPEPAWGAPVDTAGGVRARGAFALARLGHDNFSLLMADLLVDPQAQVRQAAVDSIAHRGDPSAAGLLQLKSQIGDEDPAVILACLSGLIGLTPEWGLPRAIRMLDAEVPAQQEVAALALGQSRRDDALDALLARLADEVLAESRAMLMRAIGLHRSDRALETLFAILSGGKKPDADAALEALQPRRFEPGVQERIDRAAKT